MRDSYDYNLKYKFFKSVQEIGRMNVFEFYPGRLDKLRMTYKNPGAYYLQDDALRPFNHALHRALPSFEWYGDFCFRPVQVRDLWWEMYVLGRQIWSAPTPAGLRAMFHDWDGVDAANFIERRAELVSMAEDLRTIAQMSLKRNMPLWIISP